MYLVGIFSTSLDHNASLYLIRNVINFLFIFDSLHCAVDFKIKFAVMLYLIMIVCAPLI